MRFGPVPIRQAQGKILGHNITSPDGKRMLNKGRPLNGEDVSLLDQIGCREVYVAELEPGDLGEDPAAVRMAAAVFSRTARVSRPIAGRVNLLATQPSAVRVDADRVRRINECEGVSLATLPSHSVVQPRKIAATIKVIPFALPEATICQAEAIAAENGPVVLLHSLQPRPAALILSSSPFARKRVMGDFVPALQARLEALGSALHSVDFVPLEDQSGEIALAETIRARAMEGAEIIILAGETAIMDRGDIAPRAVERAGGEVACFGAPVDPGNLLMLAYLGSIPILGAPGCVRSKKTNVIDWVLPPLLAGERLTRGDIIQMGHGGLLEDIPKRPMPRE